MDVIDHALRRRVRRVYYCTLLITPLSSWFDNRFSWNRTCWYEYNGNKSCPRRRRAIRSHLTPSPTSERLFNLIYCQECVVVIIMSRPSTRSTGEGANSCMKNRCNTNLCQSPETNFSIGCAGSSVFVLCDGNQVQVSQGVDV